MRGFALPLVLGTLFSAGTLPVVAQPVRVAAPTTTETPYRQDFEQDARARLRVWGAEVAHLNKRADAEGKRQDRAVGADLNTAWTETRTEEKQLEIAGTSDWEAARTTFDRASRRFEDALDRAHSALD